MFRVIDVTFNLGVSKTRCATFPSYNIFSIRSVRNGRDLFIFWKVPRGFVLAWIIRPIQSLPPDRVGSRSRSQFRRWAARTTSDVCLNRGLDRCPEVTVCDQEIRRTVGTAMLSTAVFFVTEPCKREDLEVRFHQRCSIDDIFKIPFRRKSLKI